MTLHSEVLKFFDQERLKLTDYYNQLRSIKNSMNTDLPYKYRVLLQEAEQYLTNKIYDITHESTFGHYVLYSQPIIDKYKIELTKPRKISFITKKNDTELVLDSIYREYVEILNQFHGKIDIKIPKMIGDKCKLVCSSCQSKDLITTDEYSICSCGHQQDHIPIISTFKDIDRINISSKYRYIRRVHFRNTMNQYQGKQNVTIKPDVYKDIYALIKSNLLENIKETDPAKKYDKVSKEKVREFLQESGHSKHYEDYVLIWSTITTKTPPDISYLEDKLTEDFDTISIIYDNDEEIITERRGRTSFFNYQFILCQLLLKNGYKCSPDEFILLKTEDRLEFHNNLCERIFTKLKWDFTRL